MASETANTPFKKKTEINCSKENVTFALPFAENKQMYHFCLQQTNGKRIYIETAAYINR
jgi:hypothetical protein